MVLKLSKRDKSLFHLLLSTVKVSTVDPLAFLDNCLYGKDELVEVLNGLLHQIKETNICLLVLHEEDDHLGENKEVVVVQGLLILLFDPKISHDLLEPYDLETVWPWLLIHNIVDNILLLILSYLFSPDMAINVPIFLFIGINLVNVPMVDLVVVDTFTIMSGVTS